MKTKFTITLLAALFSSQVFSQTWSTGSGVLYVNPSTTKVGIGTSTPDVYTSLDIEMPTNTYGVKNGLLSNVSVNGPTLIGNVSTKLTYGSSWYAKGCAYGITGAISNLSYLYTSGYETEANGGSFAVNLSNFTGSFGLQSYISGVSGALSGTVSSYPSNLIMSAVTGRDLIKGSGTHAGYFDGKVVVTGNVGIGCTNPSVPLAVNGKIQAIELELMSAPCSDFVFEKNYKLLKLSDLENYVTVNKHLPEVPSAKEFEKGYNIGTMDDILLRKIEELTLYIIEQDKRIEALENSK